MARPKGQQNHSQLGGYVAEQLNGASRIASLSLGGWDTHNSQTKTMSDQLAALSELVLAVKAGLGPNWGTTLVLALTEFGRTARENGSAGTDHGTGGAMLLAGCALRGGKVYGNWPGLREADLYQRRDLLPTTDVRAWAAHTLRGLYGIDRAVLEGAVFPGLDMGADPGLLL